jgi:hypothetical protein
MKKKKQIAFFHKFCSMCADNGTCKLKCHGENLRSNSTHEAPKWRMMYVPDRLEESYDCLLSFERLMRKISKDDQGKSHIFIIISTSGHDPRTTYSGYTMASGTVLKVGDSFADIEIIDTIKDGHPGDVKIGSYGLDHEKIMLMRAGIDAGRFFILC